MSRASRRRCRRTLMSVQPVSLDFVKVRSADLSARLRALLYDVVQRDRSDGGQSENAGSPGLPRQTLRRPRRRQSLDRSLAATLATPRQVKQDRALRTMSWDELAKKQSSICVCAVFSARHQAGLFDRGSSRPDDGTAVGSRRIRSLFKGGERPCFFSFCCLHPLDLHGPANRPARKRSSTTPAARLPAPGSMYDVAVGPGGRRGVSNSRRKTAGGSPQSFGKSGRNLFKWMR